MFGAVAIANARWTGVSGTCRWEFVTSTWPWTSSAPPPPYSTSSPSALTGRGKLMWTWGDLFSMQVFCSHLSDSLFAASALSHTCLHNHHSLLGSFPCYRFLIIKITMVIMIMMANPWDSTHHWWVLSQGFRLEWLHPIHFRPKLILPWLILHFQIKAHFPSLSTNPVSTSLSRTPHHVWLELPPSTQRRGKRLCGFVCGFVRLGFVQFLHQRFFFFLGLHHSIQHFPQFHSDTRWTRA